jgi:hypothetical protein
LPQKPGVRERQSGGKVVVVVELVVVVVDEVVVVELVVVVDEVVLVVEVVVIATAIVLKMSKGDSKPSARTPLPTTAAVAPPTMSGMTHGNGPNTWNASSAGRSTSVTRFVQSAFGGGSAGSPAASGQQKSAVTSSTSQPT